MGLLNFAWNLVKKPAEIALNTVGSAVGYGSMGSDLVSGTQSALDRELQQNAINKQVAATKYAADQAYQGQVAANNANIQMQRETNLANQQIASSVNRTNIGLAREQNQFNLEMWNRQNEYNSPANQMRLYRQAGMNPNLVAGQFSPAQQLTSADLAVAQQSSPMQAVHVDNASGQSSQILAQGAIQESNMRKEMAKNVAETNLANAQALNTYFQTHRGELILGKELHKINLENLNIIANTNRINTLTPLEKQQILVNNFKVILESDFVDQQLKTEKERTKHQQLINHAQEVNNKILDATQEDLKKMAKAELRMKLAQAFASMAKGNFDKWRTDFEKKNLHSVPDGALMTLVSLLSQDKQFMAALKKLIGSTGKAAGASADVMEKIVDKLTGIIDDPLGALWNFASDFDPYGLFE